MSVEECWQRLVKRLKEVRKATLAAECEHVEPYAFDNGTVGLEFGKEYLDLFQSRNWIDKIERYVNELFEGDWSIEWDIVEDSESLKTIANKRAKQREQKKKKLKGELREDPVVEKARSLFEPENEYTRVELDED